MLNSKFIAAIVEQLLKEDVIGIKLQPQINFITESNYEYTGSGVFIKFKHQLDIQKYQLQKKDFVLDGVEIISSELTIGASCSLFVSKGRIDYLEILSYDGNYPPKELDNYKLKQI